MPRPVALVVDDMPEVLSILVEAVRMAVPDYDVRWATSAQQAREVVQAVVEEGARLSLLLADHQLGDETGTTLILQVRAGLADPPVCFLVTGREDDEVRTAAAACGARLVPKPFRLSQFVATLADAARSELGDPASNA